MPRDRDRDRDRDRRGGRGERDKAGWGRKQRAKVCQFCKEKATWVDYKDTQLLRKFMSDRGKIRARRVTGTCAQHQRDVATAIKNAREMALLPYAAR
ncbi:MAG: 30S ribosomal protein S18 [Actinobacteria bacterium]|jgi:small subunit ribosomal protein S18|nr:MAG: 30S ribosomal protein S18 [Actinomycetota bacterium]